MVLRGRRGGWQMLTVTAVGVLLALFMFALVLGALGVPSGMGWALLAVGPVASLVLAPRRRVREWTRRSAGGRRTAAPSR
jgi:hypothetical protein